MSVDQAEQTLTRLTTTPATVALDDLAGELRRIVHMSRNPDWYGLQPGTDRVLSAASITSVETAAAAIERAASHLHDARRELRNQIDEQKARERTATGFSVATSVTTGLFGAGLVRAYETRRGTQFGPLIRDPNDPRRTWTNQRIAYNGHNVFTGTNYASRWVNSNAVTRLYGSATSVVTAIGSRIPARLVTAAGPVGAVVGAVFSYNNGYQSQLAEDAERGFTAAEAHDRAVVGGAAEAAGTVAGAVALGVVGAAVGGPIGAAVGGMIGGWLGGMIGSAVGDAINDAGSGS